MAAHGDPVLIVRVGDVEVEAFDAESAVYAAATLMREESVARVHGYPTVTFFDADGVVVGTADGSQLFVLCKAHNISTRGGAE